MIEAHFDGSPAAPAGETASRAAGDAARAHVRRDVEVGWIVAGSISRVDLHAVERARRGVLAWFAERLPNFDWRMPLVIRKEAVNGPRVEPVAMLELGMVERDTSAWDFALVLTESELVAHDKHFVLGAPSHALGTAVLSTSRLDPAAVLLETGEEQRTSVLGRRIHALAMHLLGHLMGLLHATDSASFMYEPRSVEDLDRMTLLDAEAVACLAEKLRLVADERLEEGAASHSGFSFYAKAAAVNRHEILSAVLKMRAWQFPFRFAGLTTAATSTMFVVLITEEAWIVGMGQPGLPVALLSLLSLTLTSAFVARRQGVLGRLRARRLTEQRVVSNVSIALGVVLGMATTYLLLFGVTLAVTLTLFRVPSWSVPREVGAGVAEYLTLAAFTAAIGLMIGALGASFERQAYFRHVTQVDEET